MVIKDKFYPVIVTTLNRFEHFKRCIESLKANTHADQTELIIGLDYPPSNEYKLGWENIKHYIDGINTFKKVTVFYREFNYGASRNLEELVSYAFEKYDAVIVTEDDNQFSPCFLDFMNKGLRIYYDNPQITSISGYKNLLYDDSTLNSVFPTYVVSAWGCGVWKHKLYPKNFDYYKKIINSVKQSWKNFSLCPASFFMLIMMLDKKMNWGDVMATQYNIANNKFQLVPNISLCRNWGHDGSGINCIEEEQKKYIEQEISYAKTFDFDVFDLIIPPKVKIENKKIALPVTIKDKLILTLVCLKLYLKLRFKSKL